MLEETEIRRLSRTMTTRKLFFLGKTFSNLNNKRRGQYARPSESCNRIVKPSNRATCFHVELLIQIQVTNQLWLRKFDFYKDHGPCVNRLGLEFSRWIYF